MSRCIEEKAKEIKHNKMSATNVLVALSFDKIFGSISTAHVQKIKYGKWGLRDELSKWH